MSQRVALVLGSGGARGYAHIGVIEEIERRGYTIDCIAGCSMGAVVGGVYAAGGLDAYREWVSGLAYLDVLRLLDVGFGNLGAIRGERVFGRIREILGEVNIEDLSIPFTAVATDLTNQQEVWFQQGCLHQAMRASAAIPSLFSPVRQGGRVLVDGGLLNPLPIVPVVSAHCDLIVAVNLNATHCAGYTLPIVERPAPIRQQWDQWVGTLNVRNWLARREIQEEGSLPDPLAFLPEDDIAQQPPAVGKHLPKRGAVEPDTAVKVVEVPVGPASLLELVNLSFEAMQASLTQYKIAGYPPDVLIEVPKRLCRFFEFHKAPELIELGRMVASDTLDRYEGQKR
ncbi:patatin-like phospholipase family protein [Halopseudomonas pelagia]|mgnify:CR=1 FL=1|uniref:patatin-like phospholipase family protein n=1 Tax=Halopseudomonas pelagia TaxID=553151 RepID=UPI0003A88E15|nr:patatin-like phospholipase family protein [Halopseudomonas pelagia]|tara:strand:- start:26085 stop:27107 length:1023 start_codon:yes stop_codon:yes gene_type:complete